MVVGPDSTRQARVEEQDEIDALLQAAFGRREEAELVRALRAEGAMVLEAVKSWHDGDAGRQRIGAYLAIIRMVAPENWFCLATVAVWPAWQNGALARSEAERGYYRFGSRLVRQIADEFLRPDNAFARGLGLVGPEPATLVVFGKPGFFARAGFSSVRAARLRGPWPAENLLIARPGADLPEVELIYPQAFSAL